MSKPLAERLLIPEEREGLEPLDIESSRYNFFKALFGKSGKMAKINLYAVLFALPAIAWFLYTFILRKTYNFSINYSGNLGLGYGMAENATEQGRLAVFLASLQHYLIMIPLMILAFIGLGGAFYAMRKLANGDERIRQNFFKGIRLTFADFFLHGILAGLAIFVLAINMTIYDAYGVHVAWKVLGIIGSALFIIFTLTYLLYASTISAFYKTGLKTIVKDSFLFATKLPVQSIFMALLGALPVLVLYNTLPGLFLNAGDFFATLLTTVGVALFLFLGISLVVSAWTVYTDYVYELGFGSKKVINVTEQSKVKQK